MRISVPERLQSSNFRGRLSSEIHARRRANGTESLVASRSRIRQVNLPSVPVSCFTIR